MALEKPPVRRLRVENQQSERRRQRQRERYHEDCQRSGEWTARQAAHRAKESLHVPGAHLTAITLGSESLTLPWNLAVIDDQLALPRTPARCARREWPQRPLPQHPGTDGTGA